MVGERKRDDGEGAKECPSSGGWDVLTRRLPGALPNQPTDQKTYAMATLHKTTYPRQYQLSLHARGHATLFLITIKCQQPINVLLQVRDLVRRLRTFQLTFKTVFGSCRHTAYQLTIEIERGTFVVLWLLLPSSFALPIPHPAVA